MNDGRRTSPRLVPSAFVLGASLVTPALLAPLAAQPPLPVGVHQVRPGTVIEACGGLAFRCEARVLSGTIELASDPLAITASSLSLSPLGGSGALPFPAPGDHQLTELVGSVSAGEVRFESEPGAAQTASLVLRPFGDLDGEPDGFFLEGTYDEGCCDRFVLELGVVALLPVSDEGLLELRDGRFLIQASFRDLDGEELGATPVPLDDGSGWFWFFEASNPELFVKVLDACAISGRFWFFVAGLTDLAVDVRVLDRENDFGLVYQNEAGQSFETVVDTEFYPCEVSEELPGPPG